MELRVVGLRKWVDERIQISLVLIDENSEAMYELLVLPLCLTVGLRVVDQRLVMFEPEHCPDGRENSPQKCGPLSDRTFFCRP